MNEVLPLPDRDPSHVPTEAEARADTAAGLQALRRLARISVEEWAERWGAALGRRITPAQVEAWEDPAGPKPPTHWTLVAIRMGGPRALELSSRLLLT